MSAWARRRPGAAAADGAEFAIVVSGLSKSYGSVPVLRGLDLAAAPGSVTAVLGASGSGKTTLLRVIAGFEHADSGSLTLAGRVVDDGRRVVRARHRAVGYVPQEAGLFPHLTVRANIAFGLARSERSRAADLEAMVGLGGLGHRYPHQLSGGQQQRVALARALAVDPAVVLLDEPFGALDVALRAGLRTEVLAILREAKATTVLVTHDQDEALATADRIAVLDSGRLLAHGSPRELYDHPPTPQVAAALGNANILPGRLGAGSVACRLGAFRVPTAAGQPETECLLMIRPENLVLDAGSATPTATVSAVSYHGHDTLVELRGDHPDDPPLLARLPGGVVPEPGTRVGLSSTVTPHVWIPAAPALD